MQVRVFGRTGMQLSVLGFGCGAVGGLMVRGDPLDQERAIARAIDAGVNYFDTAVQYGNGESEKNLGRVLQKLKPAHAVVGTKVRLPPADRGRIAEAITQSLEASLSRLRLDRVDIFTCTIRSPRPGTGRRSASPKCLTRCCRLSSGCASRARRVSSASQGSATRRRCIWRSTRPPLTALRWPTTCSIRPRQSNCRKIIRHRIMDGCSITPRRLASAW